ncbi:hypothetical protein QAD02_013877 [Eretmocerus hayati]|uniref:Uncharacterized protein n=1 Tax=Eretmocerus hayati TaxID=131215 RepID=A0ACC2P8I5_9HYME|nr:hypothetical protein QAD02_013877 [Eretmocerus hayati]
MLSDGCIKFDGGSVNFEVTHKMLFNYLAHLNDPVKDTRHFEHASTYMGEVITDELKEICRAEREFGDLSVSEQEATEVSELETTEVTGNGTPVHDHPGTGEEEHERELPPCHTPALSDSVAPPVHQRN